MSALLLQKFAVQANLKVKIQVFEGRDFNLPGPQGCNKCAGILSSNLISHLENLGLTIPSELVQSEIHTYILHFPQFELKIQNPNPALPILSVYRGSGPRLGEPAYPMSFDDWLLAHAQAGGAEIVHQRIQSILPGDRPVLQTRDAQIEADLVIVATGVNSSSPLSSGWGYHPPQTAVMAQDELVLPFQMSDSSVHIFFDEPQGLIFGALIAKGRYANVSLLGNKLPAHAVDIFLKKAVPESLYNPASKMLCGCAPKIAVSPAKRFFSDRMVVVGDAAVTRLYKDGIGAAFLGAAAAARTAVQRGVSRNDFAAGYLPVCRQIALDNHFGRLLFRAWGMLRGNPQLFRIWQNIILKEISYPPERRMHTNTLWHMFTGDQTYAKIFWSVAGNFFRW